MEKRGCGVPRRFTGLTRCSPNYKPESELSEIQRAVPPSGGGGPHGVVDLLAACVKYSRESDGAFDITVGR